MRHTELWSRLVTAFGDDGYARYWAGSQVIGELGSRTVDEALAAGEHPRTVWRAVHDTLGLPARDR
jgi:Protein of unknown function (DUF3046)